MSKALKVAMATYGTIGILYGLGYLIIPEGLSALQGAEEVSDFLVAIEMALGAGVLAVGVFVVVAARDPVRHIMWVRFAIVFALLFAATAVYSGLALFTEFSQALVGVILHGVFAALLLVLYPRGTPPSGEKNVTLDENRRGQRPGAGISDAPRSALP